MLNLIRAVESAISFIVIEGIALLTHNGTSGLALSTTAAGVIYKIGVTQDAVTASASSTGQAGQAAATSAPTQLTLSVSNTAPRIGDSITFTISGGPKSGTVTLYQVGLPQNNSGALTGSITLDTSGSATYKTTLSTAGPIGAVISAEGSIGIYGFDSDDEESNAVTLT